MEKDVEMYRLVITSEIKGMQVAKELRYEEIEAFRRVDVSAAMSCAGNRRSEMNEEKEVEGLQWGGSAIFNSLFAGPLLKDVLSSVGIKLEELEKREDVDKLHLHFETTQKCEDAEFYGSSLSVRMALDPERPVLLATHMNGDVLNAKHGFPCRLVAPGIIGARSVKWLERIVLRDRPSDNFYMTRDYKILPPEATPETKEEYLKKVEPLMELPLNSEICDPANGTTVQLEGENSIRVRGYALGSHGTPIRSVNIGLIPLPLPSTSPQADTAAASPRTELPHPEQHQIRLAANSLPEDQWTQAKLDDHAGDEESNRSSNKNWGWTLFSASVEVPKEIAAQARGGETKVALVAFAVDENGNKQELQTAWNLRGVAEAGWSVSRITLS